MQITPTIRVNRAHPDARGCFFAVPVIRGGDIHEATGWVSKGLGRVKWTGTPSYRNHPSGFAVKPSANTNYIGTPGSGTPWTNAFTVVARVIVDPGWAAGNGIVRVGGGIFALGTTNFGAWADSGAGNSQTGPAIVAGVEVAVGYRFRTSDNNLDWFQNGVKTGSGTLAITTVSVPTEIGRFPPGTGMTGSIRDVRVWDRYMPDATFERYYTNPNAFYLPSRPPLFARPTGALGRLTPMLRAAARH
jgi:hypothetical protein